jgi:hypothetical protein
MLRKRHFAIIEQDRPASISTTALVAARDRPIAPAEA